jgi:hypothetical protein
MTHSPSFARGIAAPDNRCSDNRHRSGCDNRHRSDASGWPCFPTVRHSRLLFPVRPLLNPFAAAVGAGTPNSDSATLDDARAQRSCTNAVIASTRAFCAAQNAAPLINAADFRHAPAGPQANKKGAASVKLRPKSCPAKHGGLGGMGMAGQMARDHCPGRNLVNIRDHLLVGCACKIDLD